MENSLLEGSKFQEKNNEKRIMKQRNQNMMMFLYMAISY